MRKNLSIYKKFIRETEGNIAVMFAVMVSVLLLGIAGAVDFSSLFNEKQKAQNVVDSATLAATKAIFINDASPEKAQKLVDEILADHVASFNLSCNSINIDRNKAIVDIECDGQYELTFGGIFGKSQLGYKVASAAASQKQLKYEVSFVFDISSSMQKSGDIPTLEQALDIFVSNRMFKPANDNNVFSLIPFGGSVAFDTSFDRWLAPGQVFEGCFTPATTDVSHSFSGANVEQAGIRSYAPMGDPFCPEFTMASQFFVNDKSQVDAMISNIQPSHGTSTSEGLMWGYRSLLPSLQGKFDTSKADFPRDFTPQNKKLLVLMTDGQPWDTNNSTSPVGRDNSLGRIDSKNHFAATCAFIKAQDQDIDIYTIGFGEAANPANGVANLLSDCVTGGGAYYSADRDSLSSVITTILQLPTDLRTIY